MTAPQFKQRLPDDWARCHDDTCREHAQCLRWTQRNIGGPRKVDVATLNTFDAPECQAFILDEAAHGNF